MKHKTRLQFVTAVFLAVFTHLATLAMGSGDHRVNLQKSPIDYQLFPRDEANLGWVEIAGTVDSEAVRAIHFKVWRDNQPWMDFVDAADDSAFSIKIPLEAGLHSYTVETWAVGVDGDIGLVSVAKELVAGDVFLVQGQSNAVATDYHGEQLANQSQRSWIRSFGSASFDPNVVFNDRNWYIADGESQYTSGSVGAWALRMAQLTVDEYGVPIALLNGAVGGTQIVYHLRNHNDRMDLNTNYGRLLSRSKAAGIAHRAKAIFWYQGESDGQGDPKEYMNNFRELSKNWLQDYSSLERIYVVQVRAGCGEPTVKLRDLLRRFGDMSAMVDVMSMTAAPGHDWCHFFYRGYRELGDRFARLIARDFHGSDELDNITAPNPLSAEWTNTSHDTILVRLRETNDQITVQAGVEIHFALLGGPPEVVVTSVETAGPGELLVHLSGPSNAKGLAYEGHLGDGAWIVNDRGIGMFAFRMKIE